MEATAKGDRIAFGILFDRHQARLVAFLTRFLGDRSLAEDIAQESFWNVWRKRETFDPRQSFRVYLYVVAKNLAINERTSARHRRTVSLDSMGEPNDSIRSAQGDGESALTATLRRDLQCTVRQALQELPENQRLCILLHEYDAYSYPEIARILECSVIAARVLGFRARNRLQRRLAFLLSRSDDGKDLEDQGSKEKPKS